MAALIEARRRYMSISDRPSQGDNELAEFLAPDPVRRRERRARTPAAI